MSAATRATTAKQRATIALGLMRQGSHGRALDDCFEMGDGDDVARELQKRARRNPNTAALINKYLAPQWHVEIPGFCMRCKGSKKITVIVSDILAGKLYHQTRVVACPCTAKTEAAL